MFLIYSFLLLLLSLATPSSSYTMGAPDSACFNMIPGHSQDPQDPSTPAPAILNITKTTIAPGAMLEFSLDATAGNTFKGFIIQARKGVDKTAQVGSFVIPGDDAGYMTCGKGIHNSITHRKSTDKTKVKAFWRAPTDYEGEVVFRYSALKTYQTFWVNIDMPPLRVTRDVGPAATPSSSNIVFPSATTSETPPATPSNDPPPRATPSQPALPASPTTAPPTSPAPKEPEVKSEEFTPRYISSTTTLRTTTTTTTTPRAPLPVVDGVLTQTDPRDDIYNGCDENDDGGAQKKGCIGMPSSCTKTRTCIVVATWLYDKGYHFQMKGRSSGYLALGLSRDDQMGDDLTTNCIYNERNGQVDIQTGYNVGKSKNEPILGARNVTGIMRGGERRYEDGWISCSWTRMDVVTIRDQVWNLDVDKYFVLLAAGSMTSGRVGYHRDTKTRAGVAKGLGEVGIVENKSRLLILLHGSFMIAAWVCSASMGILIARYYKQTWTNSRCYGLDQWFILHRSLMILTWALTIAGFGLIFWHKRAWTDIPYWVNPHAVLGCITTGLCFMQPLLALLRCSPNHRKRGWFNWIHWFIGNAAQILGIVTIFFAVDLPSAGLPKPETDWLLVAFVGFHFITHLIMSCVGCVSDSKASKSAGYPMAMRPMGGRGNGHAYPDYEELKRDAPGSMVRIFILLVYMLINVLITAVLILIVILNPFRSWVADLKVGESYVP